MKVSITYCVPCKYLPKAISLAAEIKRVLQVEPELIEGTNGIFDVAANGTMVFSKHEHERFPEIDEVMNALQALNEKA